MKYTATAHANATVANQPTFDGGGFPIRVLEVIGGQSESWETLWDEVTLSSDGKKESTLHLVNFVEELGVPSLSIQPELHTGGRVVQSLLSHFPYDLTLTVHKGLSLKGTGLGSSGATPAATLKAFESLCEKLKLPLDFSKAEKSRILKEADFGVPDNSIPAYFGGLVLIEQASGSSDLSIHSLKKNTDFGFFVLVTPKGFGIKTEDARRVLKNKAPTPEVEIHKQAMIKAFLEGDTITYGREMERAHEWFVKPRSRLYPQEGKVYEEVTQAAKEAGALGVTISGSGPTLLAIVPNKKVGMDVGQAMQVTFKQNGFDSIARLVDIEQEGAQIIQQ